MVSQEVQELLIKAVIVEMMSFMSQIFLVEKKGGGHHPAELEIAVGHWPFSDQFAPFG